MSTGVSLVWLDVLSVSAARSIADSLGSWLLKREVIAPDNRFDPLWQPSAWKPGLKARDVADASWFAAFLGVANNGVDIAAERDCHHPVENDEPPGAARAQLRRQRHTAKGVWGLTRPVAAAGVEPHFRCADCGWDALVGDWAGEFSVAVGAPAITFRNWPELAAGFVAGARAKLGRTHCCRPQSPLTKGSLGAGRTSGSPQPQLDLHTATE